MRTRTTRDMSNKHEKDIAERLGGRVTKGSGCTWKDQMDGKNSDEVPYALIWDGKSTLSKSISLTRDMWTKAQDQSGGLITMLAFRFYESESLKVGQDLVCLSLDDFAEILEDARACRSTS